MLLFSLSFEDSISLGVINKSLFIRKVHRFVLCKRAYDIRKMMRLFLVKTRSREAKTSSTSSGTREREPLFKTGYIK